MRPCLKDKMKSNSSFILQLAQVYIHFPCCSFSFCSIIADPNAVLGMPLEFPPHPTPPHPIPSHPTALDWVTARYRLDKSRVFMVRPPPPLPIRGIGALVPSSLLCLAVWAILPALFVRILHSSARMAQRFQVSCPIKVKALLGTSKASQDLTL